MATEWNDDVQRTAALKVPWYRVVSSLWQDVKTTIAVILILAVSLYVLIGTALLRPAYVEGHGVVMSRNLENNGQLPVGAVVLYNPNGEAVGTKVWHRALQTVWPIQGYAIGQIVAGPFGELEYSETDANVVTGIGNQRLTVPATVVQARYEGGNPKHLNRDVIMLCVAGPCTKGESIIAPQDVIAGYAR